jgi:hypothetical protein
MTYSLQATPSSLIAGKQSKSLPARGRAAFFDCGSAGVCAGSMTALEDYGRNGYPTKWW